MSRLSSNVVVAGMAIAGLLAAGAAGAQAQPAPLPIEISGAVRLEYDDRSGVLVAEGRPVVVRRGALELRAPTVHYDMRAALVTARGGVTVSEDEVTLSAETGELRLADERVQVRGNVVIRSTRDGPPVTIAAPSAEGSLRTGRFAATGGVRVTRDAWTITGGRLDYDDRARLAVVTGDPTATLRDAVMTAETITVWLAEERASGEGTVVLRRGDLIGRAPRVEIVAREHRATLLGGARVDRGPDRLTAETIDVDLDGARVTARGSPRLVITPP